MQTPTSHSHFTVILLTVLICSMLVGCARSSTISPSTPGSEQPIEVVPVDAYWEEALALAKDWHSDATIRTVIIGIPLPNSKMTTSPAKFSVEAISEPMETLSIRCNEQQCESFTVARNEGHPVQQCKPLHLDDVRISSQEALEIGLRNGGKGFIETELASGDITLSYGVGTCRERLTWYFSIYVPEPPNYGIGLWIDAQTGEVFEPPLGW